MFPPYKPKFTSRRLTSLIAVLTAGTAIIASNRHAYAETMVYVANADSYDVRVLTLDNSTGELRTIQSVDVGGRAMPMAFSPDRRLLYVGLRSEPFSVATLEIDQTDGRLRMLDTTPLAADMAYLSVDRTGRYLFGASYFGNLISVNPIGQQGWIQPRPVSVIPTPPNAHAILADPSNTSVLATSLGGDVILQYRFDQATGALTPNTPAEVATPQGSGPRFFVFHPGGNFVYATDELGDAVSIFAFDAATGSLTPAGSVKVAADGVAGKPADLHITPNGRFLYASERTSNSLVGWRIDDKTGALALIGHTPTEAMPRGFAIDPRGRYLLSVGQDSHAMTSFSISPDSGELSPVFRIEMGQNPNWVEIVNIP